MNDILSGIVLFTSFAMRTPNDDLIKKDDYEVTVGFKSDKVYFKRDWEQELGEKYIDDEVWLEWKPKNYYFRPQYVNKTSRHLQYQKVDARYRKGDYSIGYAGMYADKLFESGLSIGINKKEEINNNLSLEVKWDGSLFRSEMVGEFRFDMKGYTKINWKLSEKLTLSNIFDYNDVKGKEYYKFKVGFEYFLGK